MDAVTPDGSAGDEPEVRESEAGSQPVANSAAPPTQEPPSISALPLREEIDRLRDFWQFTPAEINSYIDRQRPTLVAAGFDHDQIDGYYGIERFDNSGAADALRACAQASDSGAAMPEGGPFADITRNPDFLKAVGKSPDFYSSLNALQASPELRGEVRRQLVDSYRVGACDTVDAYRHWMVSSVTGTDDGFGGSVYWWRGDKFCDRTFGAD
jgi:hypothetical protein